MYLSREERQQGNESDDEYSEGNLQLASVNNQDSEDKYNREEEDQSLLGPYEEDYTCGRRQRLQ